MKPQPGEIWQHFKGGIYEIICMGLEESTLKEMVVYRNKETRIIYCRLLENWQAPLNPEQMVEFETANRFELVIEGKKKNYIFHAEFLPGRSFKPSEGGVIS